MFTSFHHASYLVPDLDAAIGSYAETFGGRETGRGTVPGLGMVGFVQVGKVEVEFIQPEESADLASAAAPVLLMLCTAWCVVVSKCIECAGLSICADSDPAFSDRDALVDRSTH